VCDEDHRLFFVFKRFTAVQQCSLHPFNTMLTIDRKDFLISCELDDAECARRALTQFNARMYSTGRHFNGIPIGRSSEDSKHDCVKESLWLCLQILGNQMEPFVVYVSLDPGLQ
jgi:hypothetical protein